MGLFRKKTPDEIETVPDGQLHPFVRRRRLIVLIAVVWALLIFGIWLIRFRL